MLMAHVNSVDRKTKEPHKHLEGYNKGPKHKKGLSGGYPLGAPVQPHTPQYSVEKGYAVGQFT